MASGRGGKLSQNEKKQRESLLEKKGKLGKILDDFLKMFFMKVRGHLEI